MLRRRIAIPIGGAALLLIASAGSAFAAILLATLSVEAASPGAEVTVRIDMTGRQAGTQRGVLFLVPVDTYDEPTRCEGIEGATDLGELRWRAAQVAFEGSSYPGMTSETRFTVPQVPAGDYHLAENRDDPYTACFIFASFTVDKPMPDTAMAPHRPPLALMFAAALLALGFAAGRRVARLR